MNNVVDVLEGISIDFLPLGGLYSEITSHYDAIMSIIKRHPMNQFEIESFLTSRGVSNIRVILNNLKQDDQVIIVNYRGYDTYRLK